MEQWQKDWEDEQDSDAKEDLREAKREAALIAELEGSYEPSFYDLCDPWDEEDQPREPLHQDEGSDYDEYYDDGEYSLDWEEEDLSWLDCP